MPNRFDLNELGGTGADALRLFAERAAAVNPNFEVTEETYPFVLKICRRLDGMPLAIELAAARAKSLDVARIADRLDDRFRLLTGGSRTALPRQQTLAAAVDWSYELLEESEQVFFNRLAAFRGGFTLEAAESVCQGGVVDEFDVVDHLSSLVDKSMVVWEGGRGDRYRLLETLRQYALGKLKDTQAKALGNRGLQAFNYACIGIVDFHQGKYEDAIANHKRCADLERDIGSTGSEVAENLHLMAAAQFAAGNIDDASATVTNALDLLDSPRHDMTVLAGTLETLAGPLLDRGEAEFAARLWGWAMAVREEVGRPVPPPSRRGYAVIEERIATDTEDHETLAAEGAALSYEEALAAGRQALTFI
jgi:tetratricopeptide (TPR) repeat protein